MVRINANSEKVETVERARAAAADFDALGEQIMAGARAKWFVGTGASVAGELAAFAAQHGVDEVMISPIAGAYDGEPMDAAPGRVQTLELLAAAL